MDLQQDRDELHVETSNHNKCIVKPYICRFLKSSYGYFTLNQVFYRELSWSSITLSAQYISIWLVHKSGQIKKGLLIEVVFSIPSELDVSVGLFPTVILTGVEYSPGPVALTALICVCVCVTCTWLRQLLSISVVSIKCRQHQSVYQELMSHPSGSL